LANDLIIYLKTSDTCQLNCNHCFTNGSNGKKGHFNVPATIDFFRRLKQYNPHYDNGHISFHGGEPFLCPTELIFQAWNGIKELWPNIWWSIQTNLTFPLTEDKISVLETICEKSWGTSWDYGIRWENSKQEELWRSNVKMMADQGHDITVMVSLTKKLINNLEPIHIINDLASLGVKHVNFERVTANGNALLEEGQTLIPNNDEIDRWLHLMWIQTNEHKTWEFIDNMFLDSVLSSLVYNTHSGCRSRSCEQKIFTLNADGSIGGCPNSAVTNTFGTINDDILALMSSTGRACNINDELIRHPICNTCEVYDICNGDCHQLNWQGDVCAAPKSLMMDLKKNAHNSFDHYKEVLSGFMGQE
jgi:radical SAM protein with 4Fe4S-binding SPASM domain